MTELQRTCLLLIGQCVVFVGLAVLVGLGHNSAITDALMAVSGSIAGVGLYETVKGRTSAKANKDSG